MNRIVRKPISVLVFIPLILLFALASACDEGINIENESTETPLPPAATTTVSPTVTSVPLATTTSIPNAPLAVVPSGTVELSVLVEPLDVGYIEVVGSIRLSNGDATEVHKNDQINIIARPVDPALWRFDRWGGDLQGSFASEALVMDSSKKVRAIFVRVDARTQAPAEFYGVTVNGQPVRNLVIGFDNGSIEVSPAPGPGVDPFREDTIVSLTPRPNEGYELGFWGLDCVRSGSCVLTMNGHKEVTVSFKSVRHSLTVSAQPVAGGSVDPTGTTEHNYGDRVSVTAQPSSGFLFAGFSGDCSGTGSCSVLMNQPHSVTANFSKIPTPTPFPPTQTVTPVPTQILTTSSGFGGTISPFGSNRYPKGSVVEVTQVASAGYIFSGWLGTGCTGTGRCIVTVDSDKSVTANFQQEVVTITKDLTTSAGVGGTIDPFGTNSYPLDAVVTIAATPNTGYSIGSWSGGCSGSILTCSVAMSADKTITVSFEIATVTTNAPTNLSGTTTFSTATLTWSHDGQNVDHFELERRTGSSGDYATVSTSIASGDRQYTDTGLAGSTQYEFQLYAVTAGGTKSTAVWTNPTTGSADTTNAPTNLSGTTTSSTATLTWSHDGQNADHFELERRVGSSGAYATVTTSIASGDRQYTDTGLAGSTQYEFQLYAVTAGGTRSSAAWTNPTTFPVDTVNAPTSLSGTTTSSTATLTWSHDGQNVDHFELERRTGSSGDYATVTTSIASGDRQYTDTGLAGSTQYEFQLYAITSGGTKSTAVWTNPTTEPDEISIAPTNFLGSTTSSTATMTWSHGGQNLDHFELKRRLSGVGTFVTVNASISGNVREYTDTGLSSSTQYEFRLYAVGSGGTKSTPAWINPTTFPTPSTKIVFVSERDGNNEIYSMNSDGTSVQRLTDNSVVDSAPVWSPCGDLITYNSVAAGSPSADIWVMGTDGSNPTKLSDNTGYSAAWSPDCSKIAFSSERDGQEEIYIMNSDGSAQTQLTDNMVLDHQPTWSPTGDKIAFASQRNNNFDIYVMDSDGDNVVRLTTDPGTDWSPDWSPDGNKIVFFSTRDGNDNIYVMNADGSGQSGLTAEEAQDRSPHWSPDGNKIVYNSVRDGDSEIFVMDTDGTNQTQITNNAVYDAFPDWSPTSPQP